MAAEVVFEELEVGKEYPPVKYQLDEETVLKYKAAVEDQQEGVPPSIASIYFMQAYYEAFANRPKGNIHAKQNFRFLEEVNIGDELTTYLKIKDKYEKKGRKFVLVDILSQNQKGNTVLTGIMTVIWAR